jgi:preprotein translocase subunit SecG
MFANLLLEPARHTIVLASFAHYFFGITMSLLAIFLILLVLVQRGRGGGLAGAFGGMGGQSAFGTKAGDTFTKVTIGVSIAWILLCIASVKMLGQSDGSFGRASAPDQAQFAPGPAPGELPPELPGSDAGLPSGPAAPPPGDSTPAGTPPATTGGTPASSAPAGGTSSPDAAPPRE